MNQHERDDKFANTSPRPLPSKEPNPETIKTTREGDAILATGESGRFGYGADLITATLKALEM